MISISHANKTDLTYSWNWSKWTLCKRTLYNLFQK